MLRIEANQTAIVETNDSAVKDIFTANEFGNEAVVRFKENFLR